MLGRVKVDLAAEAISRPVECSEAAEKGVKEGRKVGQFARAFQALGLKMGFSGGGATSVKFVPKFSFF